MTKNKQWMWKSSRFIMNILSILQHSFIMRRGIYSWMKKYWSYLHGKVLDFGCWEKPYKQLFTFDEYIWVDFKNSGHDNHQNEVDFFWDGKSLDFKNKEFDSILSTEVFEHIFNIDEVLIELHRILKKWWVMLMTIPFVIHEHEVPYDFARYTQFWIKHLLEKHGFKIIKIEQCWSYFETILQLHIWFLGKITETRYQYLSLLLRIIFVAPIMILINIFSFVSPKMQWWLYLNNIIICEKE